MDRSGPDDDASKPVSPTHEIATIIDNWPIGYVETNAVGVIEAINSTMLTWLGFGAEELVGRRTFQDLLGAGSRIYFDTHVRPLLHMQREIREIAVDLVRSDRTRLPGLVNATSGLDPQTGTERITIIIVNATARRSYERELLLERQAAERSEARLQFMYEIVSGLAGAVTIDDVIQVVTDRGRQSISGASCSMWFLEPAFRTAVRAEPRDLPGDERTTKLAFPEGGPALDQLAMGHLVVVTDRDQAQSTYPLICGWMARMGRRSALIAPLITNGQLRGVVSYGFDDPHDFDEHELRSVRSLAVQTEAALRRGWLLDAERRSRERLESLAQLSTLLSGSVTVSDAIDVIAFDGVKLLGAAGVRVAMLDETQTMVAFTRGSGIGGKLDAPIPLTTRSIGCEAIRTGEVVVALSRDELVVRFPESPILGDHGVGRVVAAPLRRGDSVLGACVFAFEESGPPDDDDIKLIRLFAEEAGQALRRASFHEAESGARRQAELRRVISEALNRAVSTADVGQAITVQGRNAFDAEALAVFVIDPDDSSTLLLTAHDGLDQEVAERVSRIGFGTPAARPFLEGGALFLEGTDNVRSVLEMAFAPNRWNSAAVLPLALSGQALGWIVTGFGPSDRLTSATRVALSRLAAEASVALGRSHRYEVEHDVALTLQRSLLPSQLPSIDGWTISAWYAPGSEHLIVGGDLFDVMTFDDGRIVLIVGDVVGHGLYAAASMGHLRSAARALALVTSDPAVLLDGLHAFALTDPDVMYSSASCAVIRPDGSGRYACAGHPFPIIRHADGSTELLDSGRSALLGISAGPRRDASFVMECGSTLVMYTDGLVDRHGDGIDDGIARLRRTLGDNPVPTTNHARLLTESLVNAAGARDDTVTLCITMGDRFPTP